MPDDIASQNAALRKIHPHRAWVLLAAVLTIFMAAVESTIVATAMPTIVGILGGFHLFSWVFAAYLLSQAVTVPIYGRLADLYGRKHTFFFGISLFLAGSVLCGFAWNMATLVVFRAIQGLGAGAIMTLAMTIVSDLYTPAERGQVQGQISSAWGIASVAGPIVGAFLVQHLNWAMIFWVNIPVGLAAMLILALTYKDELRPRLHRIDYLGSVLLMLGTGALLLALVQASELGILWVAVLVLVSAVTLTVFFLHERIVAEPIVPLHMWKDRILAVCSFLSLMISVVMMSTTVFLPTYVQGVMGYGPLVAGFALTAMTISWPLAAMVSGRAIAHAPYRGLVISGGIGLLLGAIMLVMLTPERGPIWAGAAAILTGTGMGFCNVTLLVASQASVSRSHRGLATSSVMFMRMFGQALGAALCGGILNFSLARRLPDAAHVVEELMDPVRRAALGADAIKPMIEAVAASLHQVYLAGILLALGVLIPGWLLLPRGHGVAQSHND